MDFKKISDNAYLEWFTEHAGNSACTVRKTYRNS